MSACRTRRRSVSGSNMQAHAPEVDLELVSGFAVGDADGRLLATAGPAQLRAEALQGALGDDHPLSGPTGCGP